MEPLEKIARAICRADMNAPLSTWNKRRKRFVVSTHEWKFRGHPSLKAAVDKMWKYYKRHARAAMRASGHISITDLGKGR